MMRLLAVVTMMAVVSACNKKVTTVNPAATMHTTFVQKGGTIDPNGPCTPATPPATPDPAPPAAQRILVGYQDWRNTLTDAGGTQCQTSNAKRWEGIVTFDMSGVVTAIAAPHSTLSGTLTYHINSNKVPQSSTGIDLCVKALEIAASVPTANGLVPLNFLTGGNLPTSSPPSLGAINLPALAPVGQITSAGPATVDPAPPDPTVNVDVTMLLSDWANTHPAQLAIAFVPMGPTLTQLGIPNTPVPPNRSTAACISNVKDIALVVHVGS
jgi:hypothetical protein